MPNRNRYINTDQKLRALKASAQKYNATISLPTIIGGSLLVQVNPGGSKTFYCRYRFDNRQHELKLGKYPSCSLKDAVIKHNDYIELVHQGVNPKTFLAEQASKNLAEPLMEDLFDTWLESYSRDKTRKPSCTTKHKWRWNKYLKQYLGHHKINSVKRQQISAALDNVRKHSREETRKSMTTLNHVMRFAQSRGYIEENPCLALRPKDFNASPVEPRQRWLNLNELHKLWYYLDHGDNKISQQTKSAIQLAILTGARRTEITDMKVSELNLQKGIWTLPGSRSKNGKSHIYFLGSLAKSIIKQHIKDDKKFVFRAPKDDDRPLSQHTITQAMNRASQALDIDHFTLHDLRRSAATNWAEELKADHYLIELMLNHQPQNRLIRTYQIAQREDDKKSTWHKWDKVLKRRIKNPPKETV